MKKPTPDNQGGARPGAGRKSNASKGLEVMERLDVRFTPTQMAFIRQTAVADRVGPSDVVREAVDKIMKSTRRKRP